MAVEDVDLSIKEKVVGIRYEDAGFEKEIYVVKVLIDFETKTKLFNLSVNISHIYLERQKSLILKEE